MKIALIFLTLGIVFNIDNLAIAKKKSHARAFSYFDDGGKQTQAECDPERKVPRKLKRKKEFSRAQGYLGSELLESGDPGGAADEAWKHYFSSSSICNDSLSKQAKPAL